jgi:hypothetical protein
MNFIILILLTYLGVIAFWLFWAHKYFGKSFSWAKWKRDNLMQFFWSMAVCSVMATILAFDAQAVTFILKFMGLSISEFGEEFNISGVILGFLIGVITKQLKSKKKNVIFDTE